MDLFSYDGQMSALKDELASILSKSTNAESSDLQKAWGLRPALGPAEAREAEAR